MGLLHRPGGSICQEVRCIEGRGVAIYIGRFVTSPYFIWGGSLPRIVFTGTLVICTEFYYARTFVFHWQGVCSKGRFLVYRQVLNIGRNL